MKKLLALSLGRCFVLFLAVTLLIGMTPIYATETEESVSLSEIAGVSDETDATDVGAATPEDGAAPPQQIDEEVPMPSQSVDAETEAVDIPFGTQSMTTFSAQMMSGEPVMSLSTPGGISYFDSVTDAFAAVDAPDMNGNVTLTVLTDTEVEFSNATYFFMNISANVNAVTLDLNDKTLAFNSSAETAQGIYIMGVTSGSGSPLKEFIVSGGALNFNNSVLYLYPSKVDVQNSQIDIDGDNVTYGIWTGTDTNFTLKNSILNKTTSAYSDNYVIRNSGHVVISGGSITNHNGSGIYNAGSVSITNGNITVSKQSTGSVVYSGLNAVTIDGGAYTGAHIIRVSVNGTQEVEHRLINGTFDGDFTVEKGANVRILFENGYHKGKFDATAAGYAGAPYSTSELISAGEHDGYIKYTKITSTSTAKATFSSTGVAGFTVSDPMKSYNSSDVTTGFTVYEGVEMTYMVRLLDGYVVDSVTYTPQGEQGRLVDDYTVDEDGMVVTYTRTVPSTDYTMAFVVKEDISKPDIVSVTNSAGTTTTNYKSLTTAVAALQANDTVKLLGNLTHRSALSFSKNTTLDLNGFTLTLDVPWQSDIGVTSSDQYSVRITLNTLTVRDSSDTGAGGTGEISFNGKSGIQLYGYTSKFNLVSGTLKDLSSDNSHYTIHCKGAKTTATMSGGLIVGQVLLNNSTAIFNLSGGEIRADVSRGAVRVYSGSFNMTGGTILSGADIPNEAMGVVWLRGNTADAGDVHTITGGKIISENKAFPIYFYSELQSSDQHLTIGGNAEIEGKVGPALFIDAKYVTAQTVSSSVIINDNARLKGATYAVELRENTDNIVTADGKCAMTAVNINGGYFACGDDYIPVSDTCYVTYPTEATEDEDKVFNTSPQSAGDYAGYYTLATKASLSGSYESHGGVWVDYTYQEFDGRDVGDTGLNGILEEAQTFLTAGNDDNRYSSDAWAAFNDAYRIAGRLKDFNRNANQNEIDFRAANLSASMMVLESMTNLDVTNLADGVYGIEVEMLKLTLAGKSMSAPAFDKDATLRVKDGEYWLTVAFHPLSAADIWGRVLGMDLWPGENFTQGKAASDSGDTSLKADWGEYDNYYSHNQTLGLAGVTYRRDVDGVSEKSDAYPYPGEGTVKLPYIGKTFEESTYACYLRSDAMEASAALNIKWGTLKAIEVNPTLSLDTDSVSLIAGGTQAVKATLLAADGYTVSWSSGNTAVATIAPAAGLNATITAESAGTCTVTATAKRSGMPDLTKTVAVTVAAAGSTAVQVEDVQPGSDGVVTATLSGDVLVTNGSGGGVETANNSAVTIDVKSDPADNPTGVEITTANVIIPASVASALTGKDVTIETDMGDIKLNGAAVTQIASGVTSGSATLTVSEATRPSGLDGTYAVFYDISLTNASGATVAFNNGSAVISVPCSDANVRHAYYIKDGKRAEVKSATVTGGVATWTTDHFSLWALSAHEYEIGDASGGDPDGTNPGATDPGAIDGGFFLSDGKYYVNVSLYKETANEASMGDVAFANNRQALVTVSNGRVTTVQVGTNPVDVSGIHSAIISFRVDGNSATVLETEPMTTTKGSTYNYVKRVEFSMPSYAQPTIRGEVTYVNVGFEVPDTPMDAVFEAGEPIAARLRFVWSSASATGDSSLTADSSTASGTVSSDVLEAPAASLSDSATGIKLTAQAGVIPTDAELTVKAITSGTDFTKAEAAITEALATEETPKFKLYDISLIQSKVAIQPNGVVTISIPIPSDYDKAKVLVYRINDDGTATLIKGKVSGSNYEIGLSHLSLYALVEGEVVINDLSTPLSASAFTDITGHWAYDAILFAVEKGLFNGTSETTFSPNIAMNRGMFVTVLGRMEGIDVNSYVTAAFSDTAAGSYYTPYAAWASANGIVQGVGGSRFAPAQEITRQEMATMLNNYVNFKNIRLSSDAEVTFADDDAIASWAKDGVYALAFAGILNGVGDDLYAPAKTATRAEVATMLMRFVQGYGN